MKRDGLGRFIKGQHYSVDTQFKKGQPAHNWKGGRRRLKIGYVMINVKGHPRAYRNEVYEHIIIAEKKLGRYLEPNERVHHINGIKDDNRPENIMVFQNHKEHLQHHLKGRKRDGRGGKWLSK